MARLIAEHYVDLMSQKLGLTHAGKEDVALIEALLGLMHANQVDYTNLFRSLGHFKSAPGEQNSVAARSIHRPSGVRCLGRNLSRPVAK